MEQATRDWLQGLISISTVAVVLWLVVLLWSTFSPSTSYGENKVQSPQALTAFNVISKELL